MTLNTKMADFSVAILGVRVGFEKFFRGQKYRTTCTQSKPANRTLKGNRNWFNIAGLESEHF